MKSQMDAYPDGDRLFPRVQVHETRHFARCKQPVDFILEGSNEDHSLIEPKQCFAVYVHSPPLHRYACTRPCAITFKPALYVLQKRGGYCAVHHAMVRSENQLHNRSNDYLTIDY
jgi:hypothetical protein